MGEKKFGGAPAAAPAAAAPRKSQRIKVRAKDLGLPGAAGEYGLKRRYAGDVFYIDNERAFSERWMERVHDSTPERQTTAQANLDRQHDEILAQRAGVDAAAGPGAGDAVLE